MSNGKNAAKYSTGNPDSSRLRATNPEALQAEAEENMASMVRLWHNGRKMWGMQDYAGAEQAFKIAQNVLIGLAGTLCEAAGYDMTVKKK